MFIHPVFVIVEFILNLLWFIVMLNVVMSWLLSFGIITMRNDLVRMLWNSIESLLEPVLAPLRRILPNIGGLDFSPLVLLLAIYFITMELGALEFALYRAIGA